MRTLDRWNYRKRRYVDYGVPPEWNVSASRADGAEIIDCASCGESLPVDEAYTSLEIHTPMGFGYHVCWVCHEAEIKRKLRAAEHA